ncbi:MAG TPA: hypothetical protein VGY32_11445 [Solirubrobacteraceae bacterium]|nr:hypothetical protein [Solirubrobacteraceae bacterium]
MSSADEHVMLRHMETHGVVAEDAPPTVETPTLSEPPESEGTPAVHAPDEAVPPTWHPAQDTSGIE